MLPAIAQTAQKFAYPSFFFAKPIAIYRKIWYTVPVQKRGISSAGRAQGSQS